MPKCFRNGNSLSHVSCSLPRTNGITDLEKYSANPLTSVTILGELGLSTLSMSANGFPMVAICVEASSNCWHTVLICDACINGSSPCMFTMTSASVLIFSAASSMRSVPLFSGPFSLHFQRFIVPFLYKTKMISLAQGN